MRSAEDTTPWGQNFLLFFNDISQPFFFLIFVGVWLILNTLSFCCVCMWARSVTSSSLQLHDCSPPGSSVHGILQARMLEWVAISSSRESSGSRDQARISCVSCFGRWILYYFPGGKPQEIILNPQGSEMWKRFFKTRLVGI